MPKIPDDTSAPRIVWRDMLLMSALETYARVRRVYKTPSARFAIDYPLRHFPPNPQSDRPWIALGDSLTEGTGAKPGHSYVDYLSKLAGRPILNQGICGHTTDHVLGRLQQDVLQHKPSLVIMCLGANDIIQKRTPEHAFENLTTIVEQLHAIECAVMLLGLRGSWLYKIDMDTPARQLSRKFGLLLRPLILDKIWGNPFLMADIAHPNHRGYRRMAERVWKCLQPHLQG